MSRIIDVCGDFLKNCSTWKFQIVFWTCPNIGYHGGISPGWMQYNIGYHGCISPGQYNTNIGYQILGTMEAYHLDNTIQILGNTIQILGTMEVYHLDNTIQTEVGEKISAKFWTQNSNSNQIQIFHDVCVYFHCLCYLLAFEIYFDTLLLIFLIFRFQPIYHLTELCDSRTQKLFL